MAGWSVFDCFWLRFHALNETGQAGLKVAQCLFDVLGHGLEKSSVMSCLQSLCGYGQFLQSICN